MKINGSLVFDASSASEIQNLRVQKYTTANLPAAGAADVGRLIFNTDTGVLSVGASTGVSSYAWVALATGGNAAALQTEVDNLETSLGALVNSSGVFQIGTVTFGPNNTPSNATNLTGLLQELSNAISGKDALSELVDVSFGTLVDGQYLKYDLTAGKWKNETLVLTDVTDVTATAAEVNVLHGITASTTELNYSTGVTSSIQTQLNNKQPLDATLTGLAGMTGTGFVVENGTDTFTHVTLVAPAAGFTINNADGVAGNPTFALADDLAALEGLSTNGIIVRTGDGTAVTRSVTGSASRVVVTNGDGVAGSPTVDLAAVTDSGSGTFLKLSTDSYGRVTGTTAVVTADITALVDATYVNVAGDTMTGVLNMGSNKITGVAAPTVASDAVNKAYADALAAGLSWKMAVRVASTANFDLSLAPSAIDGVTLAIGDRVLVKDQTTTSQNGIYVFNGSGSAMTRAADMDAGPEFDGAAVFVMEGSTYASSGWTETATVASVGTDPVLFSQFTGGALYTWGTGLSLSGNTVNVNLGAGIAQLPTDEVGVDVVSNLALQLTDTTTAGQLTFVLASGSGLEQSASGLKISLAGVTNDMLAHPAITLDADAASTGSIALGGTLSILGNSTQGVSSSVSGTTFTLTMADASTSQKGVASFDANDFAVSAGVVTIANGGVDNIQLANSSLQFGANSGSNSIVALGGTMSIKGAGAISTANNGSDTITISAGDATTTVKGVASFNPADFTVSSGAVSAIAKDLDSLTDVTITSPAEGQTLVYDGTSQFVNRKVYHKQTFTSNSTWTVTHGLGQQFVNVTVMADAGSGTYEVVIPQSITMTDSNNVVVTFNSAIAGAVVVMGIA